MITGDIDRFISELWNSMELIFIYNEKIFHTSNYR